MAEGLLTRRLPNVLKPHAKVSSAGTHGLHGNMADAFAIQAAAAHGVDISGHRARLLDARMIRSADLVLAMEKQHITDINSQLLFRCKHLKLLGEFSTDAEPFEIKDPYGSAYGDYEATANDILRCLPGLISFIHTRLSRKAS